MTHENTHTKDIARSAETRQQHERLIALDIAWLRTLPRTPERDHVIGIVGASPTQAPGPPCPPLGYRQIPEQGDGDYICEGCGEAYFREEVERAHEQLASFVAAWQPVIDAVQAMQESGLCANAYDDIVRAACKACQADPVVRVFGGFVGAQNVHTYATGEKLSLDVWCTRAPGCIVPALVIVSSLSPAPEKDGV